SGKRAATVTADGTVHVWNTASEAKPIDLLLPPPAIDDRKLTPRLRPGLVFSSDERFVFAWDVRRVSANNWGFPDAFYGHLWCLPPESACAKPIEAHSLERVECRFDGEGTSNPRIAFSPDGAVLVAAGRRELHRWVLASGRPVLSPMPRDDLILKE